MQHLKITGIECSLVVVWKNRLFKTVFTPYRFSFGPLQRFYGTRAFTLLQNRMILLIEGTKVLRIGENSVNGMLICDTLVTDLTLYRYSVAAVLICKDWKVCTAHAGTYADFNMSRALGEKQRICCFNLFFSTTKFPRTLT